MHLIAVNDQVSDGSLGVGTVYSNAKPVAASSRKIAAVESLLNVMDVVLQEFYMGAGSHDAYTQWGEAMLSGAEVANFETLDPYVTLVVNSKYTLSSRRGEVRCIEDRRVAW